MHIYMFIDTSIHIYIYIYIYAHMQKHFICIYIFVHVWMYADVPGKPLPAAGLSAGPRCGSSPPRSPGQMAGPKTLAPLLKRGICRDEIESF